MDEIVRQAMAKWPNVPAVYGWLQLDRRGNWLIKSETISNEQLNAFISRNYLHDESGNWFFQNGPQRVYVELAYMPLVYIVPGPVAPTLMLTHTRKPVQEVRQAWIDDSGTLLLETEHGVGHVSDLDLELLLACFVDEAGQAIDEDTLEARFDAFAAGTAAPLWFRYGAASAKIACLRAADAPEKFGHVPRPTEKA